MTLLKVIGIATETTNKDGKSGQDLAALWERFYSQNILEKIPGKASNEVYSIFTDYETDYTGKYTTIIGARVTSFDDLPDGLVGRLFEPQNFKKFTAKGKMPDAVVHAWKKIWDNDKELNRSYIYDFEVYGERSRNGENSEVDIFVGVN